MAQMPVEDDEEDNEVAEGLYSIARALQKLGNGDASTHFGAIEGASMVVEEIGRTVADRLDHIADSLDHLDRVADKVEDAGTKVADSLDRVADSLRVLATVYAQVHSVTPEAR